MQIGDLRVDPVMDGVAYVLPDRFRGVTPEQWTVHQRFLNADGKIELALGGFLVRGGGDRVVLVDNGVGHNGNDRFKGGALLDNLAALGVQPGDVTDVIFTHLHFDHVGWTTDEGRVVFPNATVRCHARDWSHFVEGAAESVVRPVLSPIADKLQTWDGTGPLLPGIDTMVAAGHTPGSTILVLSSGTHRGLLLGDVAHCPVELEDDEWGGLGDVDPTLARETRNALAREIEGTNIPVAAAHFPGMEFGRLLLAEGRRSWLVD